MRRRVNHHTPKPHGSDSANTGRNCGTVNAVMVIAPANTNTAESSGPPDCANIISMFSTSRTTLDWMIEAFDREWNPIDSNWSREAKAFR